MKEESEIKISIFTYEPALWGDSVMAAKTGGSLWLPTVINHLVAVGHKVSFVYPLHSMVHKPAITEEAAAKLRPSNMPVLSSYLDIANGTDVALFYYRWPMADRPERHYFWQLQQLLFKIFDGVTIPYIVFDGDHQLSNAQALKIIEGHGKIAAPELRPLRNYVRPLFYPNVSRTTDLSQIPRDVDMTYVGNDYGRRQQTIEFLEPISNEFEVKVFGNWGTSDEAKKLNSNEMPKVKFMGPVDGSHVIDTISKSRWTIHLAKPSYIDSGFCTFRWVEAAIAGTPAIVPSRFPVPKALQSCSHFGFASDGHVASKIMRDENRSLVLQLQRQFVDLYFQVEEWETALVDCYKDR